MAKFHRKYYPNSDKYYMTAEYFDNYIYTDYAPFSTTGRQANPTQQVFKKELEENIAIVERATTEYQDRTYDRNVKGRQPIITVAAAKERHQNCQKSPNGSI